MNQLIFAENTVDKKAIYQNQDFVSRQKVKNVNADREAPAPVYTQSAGQTIVLMSVMDYSLLAPLSLFFP